MYNIGIQTAVYWKISVYTKGPSAHRGEGSNNILGFGRPNRTHATTQGASYNLQHTAYVRNKVYGIQPLILHIYGIQHTAYNIRLRIRIQHTAYRAYAKPHTACRNIIDIRHMAYGIRHTAHTAYGIWHMAYGTYGI